LLLLYFFSFFYVFSAILVNKDDHRDDDAHLSQFIINRQMSARLHIAERLVQIAYSAIAIRLFIEITL